jgi:dsRNA-specific ribonuclease
MPLNNYLRKIRTLCEEGSYRLYSTKNTINPRINEIIEDISNTKNFIIALTHKSITAKDSSLKSYETLEFLGDSLLELYVSLFLYYSFPEYSEGKLTQTRTKMVQGSNLSSLCFKIGLYKYLNSEAHKKENITKASSAQAHRKVLEDIFESFIAALYIERGGKALYDFLFLTVLDKPEFKSKFHNFNSKVIPLLCLANNKMLDTPDTLVKQNIKVVSSSGQTLLGSEKVVPITNLLDQTSDINLSLGVITDDKIKAKLSLFMDKSIKNHEDILEILVKIYVLMEYNSNKGQ